MNSRTLWNDNWYFAKTELGVKWEDRQIWEAKMQPVDLPHDWLIYDTKNLYEDSIGWYRKNFAYAPDKTGNDDRVILRFEGGYMDSSIYVILFILQKKIEMEILTSLFFLVIL